MSLNICSLSFSYGSNRVLDNISFSCVSGELISVLGRNGAGKSTLFKCMLGLLRSFEGQIYLCEKSIRQLSPKELARLAAYIPQSHYHTFNYSVLDMVLMGTAGSFSSFSSPGKAELERSYAALQSVGIEDLAKRSFNKLSGGERQLTLIARALAQQARVLILDEPTANLDFGNRERVISCITKLSKSGCCVLQSTHDPELAYRCSDRVLALKGGKVLGFDKPNKLFTEDLIFKLYEAHVHMHSLDNDRVRVFIPAQS